MIPLKPQCNALEITNKGGQGGGQYCSSLEFARY